MERHISKVEPDCFISELLRWAILSVINYRRCLTQNLFV